MWCEQFLQAEKAKYFKDNEALNRIMRANSSHDCQRLGHNVKNFDNRRWEKMRYDILYKCTYEKFNQHNDLKDELLRFDKKMFVKASPTDKIYGIGMSANDLRIHNPNHWDGLNLLGKALTEVRDELCKELYKNEK